MRLFASLLFIGLAYAGPPVEGNAKSPIRVRIYEDLQEADCAKVRLLLDSQLLAKYGAHVAFEHHDFPQSGHGWARRAAMAARFFDARNPKLGIEFRRQILASRETVTSDDLPAWVVTFARQFAVDPVGAVASLESPTLSAMVDQDMADGAARGVARAPMVFVGEQPVELKSISESIEAALTAAKKP
jgi:protein-disulfide isomerase